MKTTRGVEWTIVLDLGVKTRVASQGGTRFFQQENMEME